MAGIRTDRVLLSVYTVAGALYAIGAWILMGRLASASPNVGVEYNLDSITAVVLGGTSLFGAGVEVVWQGFAIGLLVLVAVSIDQCRRSSCTRLWRVLPIMSSQLVGSGLGRRPDVLG